VSPKKRILHVSPFDDIKLAGISTTLKDYKLAYFLNTLLRLDLKRMNDFVLPDLADISFSFYYYDEGENQNVINLIQGKNEGYRLLPPKLPLDFLLLIRNPVSDERFAEWLQTIKKIQGIITVFELDVNKHKEIDPLLEQMEFHEFKLMREGSLRKSALV
jgi:hypothetical protein